MLVPLITSVVSTIHVVSFFELSNYYILSLILALAFELGALSALAGLVVMDRINKSVIWFIFILLTAFQMVGNTYFSYDTTTTKMITETGLIKNFSELFGFVNENADDVIFIKRMIAIITGGVLPVISLSFLHLLMSYVSKTELKPEVEKKTLDLPESTITPIEEPVIFETTPMFAGADLLKEPEPVVESKNEDKEDFATHLERKKKKLDEDKKNYFPMLRTLFKDGTSKEGDELPSYSEFISMVESGKYTPEVIKTFLTLCNFLDITKVSGQIRKALKSYEDAHKTLEDYLSFEYEVK
jgi:hypothetical protein